MLSKIYRGLIYVLPLALFFSYYPVIVLGTDEAMNLELSVPLIWLAVFDAIAMIMIWQKKLLADILKKWQFLILPIFATISLVWSSNLVRGVLTVGIMWLLYFAVFAFWILKDLVKDDRFKKNFWRWFFGSTLVICGWCAVQCILDVMGVPRECSLLCAGCTSWMFGFPHPNGFAIEPQFMGNLLLAPAIMVIWAILITACPSDTLRAALAKSSCSAGHAVIKIALLSIIFISTLFLTFSRGAIYAFLVAMVFLMALMMVQAREKERKAVIKRAGMTWGLIVLAFLFALNLQGVLTQVGPTSDTYYDGVAKALNHLSLGVIDIRQEKDASIEDEKIKGSVNKEQDLSEKSQAPELEIVDAELVGESKNEPIFDGYVEESTEIRKMMTRNAIDVWRKDFGTMMLGVGIGGAGQAMYDAGLTDSPKEIVQNEYASLLLEIGVIGVILVIVTVILIVRTVVKNQYGGLILTLIVAYGVSLSFFSGLPNALQIYLLPALFYIVLRKKLVS